MQKIIDDLLQLAEIRGTETRRDLPIDLSKLVSDMVEDLASLKSGHKLDTQIQGEVFMLGNPDQMEKLISNLIGNINAHVPADSQVSITLASKDSRIFLTFEDSGPGFPEGLFSEAGKPIRFRKGDGAKSGSTGLGLSMIYEVVENHSGKIEVGSSRLGGALISISLPISTN